MVKPNTYRCVLALKSLLLIAGFSAYMGLNANHILGGEVSYTHLGGKKYKFTTRLYRNCQECEFNTGNCADVKNLDVFASPSVLNYALKLSTIPLTKISKRDVTQLCKGATSKCTGGSFQAGVEEWVFEGSIDFDTISPDYCQFEVGIRVESRKDVFNQGVSEAFYNYARINICDGLKNNSPVFQAPIYNLLPQNQSFTYNILAKDPDGDSLSYELVNAAKAWKSSVSYTGSYSGQQPLDVYCPSGSCVLDRTKWPIEGIGIDANTGWMGFTPTQAYQETYVVIEVTEWRKVKGTWTKLGTSRRDMQISVILSNNNIPKISTSSLSYYACAEQDFMLDFSVLDAVYGGVKDSISLVAYSNLPGFGIQKVKGSAKNQFDAFFTVPVKNIQIREKPYNITIVAIDDNCPITSSTYKTIEIVVTGVPGKSSVLEFIKCNQIAFTSSVSGSSLSHSWFLMGKGGMLDSRTGLKGEFQVPEPGKYYIIHQINNAETGCQTETKDSIDMPYFSLIKESMKWPVEVCSNEPFSLSAEFSGGTYPFQYFWNNIAGDSTKTLDLYKDSILKLEIIDSKGCNLDYAKLVKIHSRSVLAVSDTSMCLPVKANNINLNNRVSISPSTDWSTFAISYLGSAGTISKPSSVYLFEPSTAAQNIFQYNYKDKNLCSYKGEFIVNVVNPLPTGIVAPQPICSNAGMIDLNTATDCDFTNGIWNTIPPSTAVANNMFDPQKAGVGMVALGYEKDLSGCLIRDTTFIKINAAPIVNITKPSTLVYCSDALDIELESSPENGQWTNNAGMPFTNRFSPAMLSGFGLKSAIYYYAFTNVANQCKASDSIVFVVNKSATIESQKRYEVCELSDLQLLPNPEYAIKVELIGDFSGIRVKRLGGQFILDFDDVNKTQNNLLNWKITALEGCPDQVIPFEIEVKPRPEVNATSSPQMGCSPLPAFLEIQSLNSNVNPDKYFWRDGLGWTEGTKVKPVNLVSAGDYSFAGKASLKGCMSDETMVSIRVFASPIAHFTTDPASAVVTTEFSHLAFFDATQCIVPYSIQWNFEKGYPAISAKKSVDVDFPADTGLYLVKLTATTTDGCVSTTSRSIRVKPSILFYIPNIFTPDGKGPADNEVFKVIVDSSSIENFRITLRNRWGEIVFSSNVPSQTWDGNYLGKSAPAGTYIWELEATTVYGVLVRKAGHVSLIR